MGAKKFQGGGAKKGFKGEMIPRGGGGRNEILQETKYGMSRTLAYGCCMY